VQLWLPGADGSAAVAENDRPLTPVIDLAG
jgi:hypothetical protein